MNPKNTATATYFSDVREPSPLKCLTVSLFNMPYWWRFKSKGYMSLFVCFFVIILYADVAAAQVSIPYQNPEIHSRQASGQIPQKTGILNETGTLTVDRRQQRIIMRSDDGHTRSFYFFHWEFISKLGHTIGYGDNHAFSFVPQDRYFGLMFRRNNLYLFTGLPAEEIQLLNEEFKSVK